MNHKKSTLTLSGKRGGKQIYTVEQASTQKVAAGGAENAFDANEDFSRPSQRRADRLGVKIHSRKKQKTRCPQPEMKQLDNIGNNNVVGMPENDYFGNCAPANDGQVDGDLLDDDAAIRAANALAVSDMNEHYRDDSQPYAVEMTMQGNSLNPNGNQAPQHAGSYQQVGDNYGEEPKKQRRRGTGFLGRNKHKSRNSGRRNNEQVYM